MALFNLFNPDTDLPSTISTCVANPSADCDKTIGSTMLNTGYCSTNPQSIVCGCVNNSMPCPQKLSPYCGEYAYHPSTEAAQSANCPDIACVNFVNDISETSGNTGDIVQACGMSSVSSSGIVRFIFFHPLIILVILFIIIVIINVAVYKYVNRNKKKLD